MIAHGTKRRRTPLPPIIRISDSGACSRLEESFAGGMRARAHAACTQDMRFDFQEQLKVPPLREGLFASDSYLYFASFRQAFSNKWCLERRFSDKGVLPCV